MNQEENQGVQIFSLESSMSAQVNELFLALSLAQGGMESAKKDSTNPFFKSKYADYASVWDAVSGPLSKNGLSYILLPSGGPETYTFTGILAHKSGQFLKTSIRVKPTDPKIQAYGSLITYVKRYMLTSLTGVAVDEDDDGNSASQRQPIQGAPKTAREVKNYVPQKKQSQPDWLQETASRVLKDKDIPERM